MFPSLLNQATRHWHTGSPRRRVTPVCPGYRVYECPVDRFRRTCKRERSATSCSPFRWQSCRCNSPFGAVVIAGSHWGDSMAGVVDLSLADKYHRLTHRPPKDQKGLYERMLLTSQRPSGPWGGRRVTKLMRLRGSRLRRDRGASVLYAEELNAPTSAVTLQSTDRHGILGQKSSDFQVSL